MVSNETQASGELSDQDKLMGLLSYVIQVLIPLVVLLGESKNQPFQRYHAVQSLGVSGSWVIIWIGYSVLSTILTVVTFGLAGLLLLPFSFILWLAEIGQGIWYGLLAYQGKNFEVPVVTTFMKGQKWL